MYGMCVHEWYVYIQVWYPMCVHEWYICVFMYGMCVGVCVCLCVYVCVLTKYTCERLFIYLFFHKFKVLTSIFLFLFFADDGFHVRQTIQWRRKKQL